MEVLNVMQQNIAEIIKQSRKEKNLSMRNLAQLIGIDHSHIGKIEKGLTIPSRELITKLCTALEIDEVMLQRLAGNYVETDAIKLEEEFPEAIKVLRDASQKLSPEAKKKMLQLIKKFTKKQ